MGTRLNITLFGTYCVVGAVLMKPAAVRAGINAFGKKEWQSLLADLALGIGGNKASKTIGRAIKHPVSVVFQSEGIALHDDEFGMEVFRDGIHHPVDVVAAQNRALQARDVVQDYNRGDVLGVFRGERPGVMAYQWENADSLEPEDVVMVYDTMTRLVPDAGIFELVVDMTYQNKPGVLPRGAAQPLVDIRQVLHSLK